MTRVLKSNDGCPLCGEHKLRKVLATPRWSVMACLACTNAWTEPPPVQIDYEAKDFHSETNVEAATPQQCEEVLPGEWRASIHQQVALLKRWLPPRGRVLEVGCGGGILLEQLREAGFEVCGVEPSHTACRRALARGLHVYQGYFPSKQVTDLEAPFDAVVMTHVLEHISHPEETLKAVSQAAPNGFLLLVQTYWRGLIPKLRGPKWYAWVPDQHFWHFTPEGVDHFACSMGFRALETEFSRLVPAGRTERLLSKVSCLVPRWRDQFHLLLRAPGSAPDKTETAA